MCLCPGSQPVRAGVGAGNAPTASRLPAWHQSRWMLLIVTVCNVFNSIIPSRSLSLFSYNIAALRSPREASLRGAVLYVSRDGRPSHDFIYHTSTSSPGCNSYGVRLLTIMCLAFVCALKEWLSILKNTLFAFPLRMR